MYLPIRLLLERLFTSVAVPKLTICAFFESLVKGKFAFSKDMFAVRCAAKELIWIFGNSAVSQNTSNLGTLFLVEHLQIQ